MSTKSRNGLVAFVAIALGAPALAIGAASAATIVGAYYEDAGALTCNSTQCIVYFSNLPAGKNLIAQRVSCRIETSNPAAFSEMELTSKQSPQSNRFVPTWTATNGNFRYYLANADVLHLATTQPFVRMKTMTGTVGQIYCTIGGELVPAEVPRL